MGFKVRFEGELTVHWNKIYIFLHAHGYFENATKGLMCKVGNIAS